MPAPMMIARCGAVGIFPSTRSGSLPTFVEIGVELLVLRDGLVLGEFGDAGAVSSRSRIAAIPHL
jgi:hypothetical protein